MRSHLTLCTAGQFSGARLAAAHPWGAEGGGSPFPPAAITPPNQDAPAPGGSIASKIKAIEIQKIQVDFTDILFTYCKFLADRNFDHGGEDYSHGAGTGRHWGYPRNCPTLPDIPVKRKGFYHFAQLLPLLHFSAPLN